TKCSQARKWLEETKKVQIVMRFRGRMMTRQEVGRKVLNEFIEALSDAGQVEKAAQMEGNIMTCMISPLKKQGGKQNAKDENKQLVSKTGKEDR
ncbi:MAG: translation initiation factor IF-3 C-terminal domain-containing protein, partial [Erysipelotrichales bacterium]|nr:translation initiation factor IF-3 C-terminal domain-containing protein [Erysipelotrichales bacterium]